MVGDKFMIILTGLLELEDEYKKLLAPIRCLHQVEALELRLHVPVRILYWIAGQTPCTLHRMGTNLARNVPYGTTTWAIET